MSSLIDSINASNTSFTEEQKQKEAELKQKENDDYLNIQMKYMQQNLKTLH